jgi:hypothetical protein
VLVSKLLYIKVVHLESSVGDIRFMPWFHHLEEECMVVGILRASVDMEEAGDGFLAAEDNVAWCQGDSAGVPFEHLFVFALRVRDSVMTPSKDWSGTRLEALEFAFARLFVFVVDGELFELYGFRGLLLPAVDEMHEMSSRILQCDNLASYRAM